MKTVIERLGHLGHGIAPGPIFVPMALPGEEVEGEVEGDKMLNVRVLTPSDQRVKPPCSHFKSCGGCGLQHANDGFVADWKQSVVVAALAAQGINADFRDIETSPANTRRRAGFSGRRTKKGALVGMHTRASDTIVAVPNCKILTPGLLAIVPALEELTVFGASRKSELSFLVTDSEGGIDVSVTGGQDLTGPTQSEAAQIAARHGLARLAWNEEVIVEITAPVQILGDTRVVPPAGSFLQASKHGQETLISAVLETVSGAKKVVDLFAGCGTFTLPVAKDAEVHAVESGSDMLAALDKGWRLAQGLKSVSTETRDLFRRPLLPDEFKYVDAVVIDPPRAGAEAQMRELAQSGVGKIAAVSCNPVSFARDAKILTQAGYRLDWVQVVDQFRWSPHVEIAASFTLL